MANFPFPSLMNISTPDMQLGFFQQNRCLKKFWALTGNKTTSGISDFDNFRKKHSLQKKTHNPLIEHNEHHPLMKATFRVT